MLSYGNIEYRFSHPLPDTLQHEEPIHERVARDAPLKRLKPYFYSIRTQISGNNFQLRDY